MFDRDPQEFELRLRELLGEPEAGDDAFLGDPTMLRLVDLLDDIGPDDALESPPPGLWDAIAEEAGVSRHDTSHEAPAEREPITADGESDATGGSVVPLRRGAGSAPPWWMGAAAAVLVVLVVAIGALAIMSDDDPEPTPLASADLDVLLASQATGAASLVSEQDVVVLELDVDGLEPIDGYYEVWLLTPEVDGLISLGPLRSDGRYEVPDGLDHTRFSVVDVSIEPHDGDPNHSGNSILRGGLVEL